MRILFVCSGNICRSPMAEGMLPHLAAPGESRRIRASSAGSLGIVGEPADADAVRAASERGFDISSHRSRALTAAMIDAADIVLVMEQSHLRAVRELSPDHPDVRLLGAHLPASWRSAGGEAIEDPIGCGIQSFRDCLRRIEKAVAGLLADLRRRDGLEGGGGGSAEAEQRYFRGIESAILAARGGGAGLTSMEFHVADGWWRRGLPLWLVLEALSEAASAWPAGEAPRGFLRKAEAEVELRAAEAGYAVGAPPPVRAEAPAGDPGERAEAIAALTEALARLGPAHPEIRGAIEEIRRKLRSGPEEAPLDGSILQEARARLCSAARSSLPMGAIQSIEREEGERLGALSARLTEAARKETLSRLIDDRILEWFGLPSMEQGRMRGS